MAASAVALLAACGAPGPAVPAAPPSVPSAPATSVPGTAAQYPGQILDLRDWYLTLPTGTPEDPDTVHQPELETYSGPYFRIDDAGTGVLFTANAGGATTKGSSYPRSELREMDGTEKASWSNTVGTHTMTVRGAVLALPPAKPEIVVAQIHDADDDVVLVRVEDDELLVEWDDGDSKAVLDPAYRLGSPYDVRITATEGRIDVYLGGERKVSVPLRGSGWYFKAGAYLQSNVDRGDAPDAVGEAVIEQLRVEHSA
ncbi:MAG: polysaccharide lyase family 7 protein [Pseudonocardia sp.]